MALRVTFLRHAESEFNADPSSCTPNCSLSQQGIQQARALNGYWPIVLVSPLQRALLTLAHSSISYGERHIWAETREQRVDPCDFFEDEDSSSLESDEQLMSRADQFLARVQQHYARRYSHILVVSHCEFICAITAQSPQNAEFDSIELRQMRAEPAIGDLLAQQC
jgi:broad specificity phosphatase PhoE